MSPRLDGAREASLSRWLAFTPFILQKSRMRRRARTDLCGGRSAMGVPTATITRTKLPVCRPAGNYSTQGGYRIPDRAEGEEQNAARFTRKE
jgi:hypothetical protein